VIEIGHFLLGRGVATSEKHFEFRCGSMSVGIFRPSKLSVVENEVLHRRFFYEKLRADCERYVHHKFAQI
jgi:hypothetical protein